MKMSYIVLLVAVICISLVQLIVKYRFDVMHGQVPADRSILIYIFGLFTDPWMWLAGITLIVSALLWYFALSRLFISTAIAFAALVYPLVMIGGVAFLGEIVTRYQMVGCVLIVTGIWFVAYYSQSPDHI